MVLKTIKNRQLKNQPDPISTKKVASPKSPYKATSAISVMRLEPIEDVAPTKAIEYRPASRSSFDNDSMNSSQNKDEKVMALVPLSSNISGSTKKISLNSRKINNKLAMLKNNRMNTMNFDRIDDDRSSMIISHRTKNLSKMSKSSNLGRDRVKLK